MKANLNKLYENIITSMEEGVLVFDRGGRFVLSNEKGLELLGLEEESGKNLVLRDLMLRDDCKYDEFIDCVFAAIFDREVRTNSTISFDHPGGGARRYLITTAMLKTLGKETDILVVINDITEVEKLHETFGRYMSDEVARTILEDPNGLEMGGSLREVTILMSDLRGFTAICERMEAGDITDMLGNYFAEMNECINRHRGTIIEFLGDGILAVFGAPVDYEDHASEAVAAAVEMQKSMEDINRLNLERGYPRLSMGIGIHTGETVVGNIGCEKRTKYGVLGSNVNLAGRIESYSTGGQILVSETARSRITEELIVARELKVSPKGVDGILTMYRVIGIGGDYNLSYEPDHEPLLPLEYPYLITLRRLNGKDVTNDIFTARVLAASGERVRIQTKGSLKEYENVRMDIAGELYGKVIDVKGEDFIIEFTSQSEGYDLWFNEIKNIRE